MSDDSERKQAAPAPERNEEFEAAVALEKSQPDNTIKLLRGLVARADPSGALSKVKEDSVYRIGQILARLNRAKELAQLLIDLRPFFQTIPKGKTAKIVRSLIEFVGKIPDTERLQTELCENAIEWCKQEQRTLLRQRIQTRLTSLYLAQKKYKEAIALILSTEREVKKFDDKLLLVEIQLIESRVHYALENIPKAKGSLTAARSSATAIYCPPLLQAEIDMQAGVLCGEEKDFKTAFSYFYEAFEGWTTVADPKQAVLALKYMLLSKIMLGQPEDVYSIINGKVGVKHAGIAVEAMRAVADAYKKRDIHLFENVFHQYQAQLGADAVIARHLSDLKDNLLEQNLIRLIEPFSRVQISHVAKLIALPQPFVENKLSGMILDKKLNGILDQGSGDLIVFDEPQSDKTYSAALDTIKELSVVVDRLFSKARLHVKF